VKQAKKKLSRFFKQWRPKVVKLVRLMTHSSLPEIAFVSGLIFGKYLANADFQYPGEVVIPIIIFAVIATVVVCLFRLILKNWFAARVASLSLIYALYSFNYLPNWLKNSGKLLLPKHFETVFSGATLTVLIIAILAGMLGLGCKWAVHHVKLVKELQPYRILLFIIFLIFSFQSLKVVHKWLIIHRELTYHYPAPSYPRAANTKVEKPDIYYFVFEDYANDETLKNMYGYDNSSLNNYLSGQGFVYKQNAMANYPFTMQSVSSTFAMQYHTDLGKLFSKDKLGTAFPYRSIFENPPVAQLLKQNGYIYNQLSSWWDFTRVSIKADNQPTISFRLRFLGLKFYMTDLSRDIINKSILSQWLKKGVTFGNHSVIKYDLDNNPRENFFAQKEAVKSLAGSVHAQPQFTFAHFLAPHNPYVFDADGSYPPYDGGRNDDGVPEKEKYTREITYVNTQIEDMMGYIREHSPNAVIIIQSDEGSYPDEFHYELDPKHYYDPSTLPIEKEKQKFGISASYFMPGVDAKTVTTQITSSVNAFRFVLQHYLGYNLDMLPECYFSAGDKFSVYNFHNETPKLLKNASPACDSL